MVSNPFRTVGPKDENGDPKWVRIPGVPGKIGPGISNRTPDEIRDDRISGAEMRCQYVDPRKGRCKNKRMSGNACCRKCQGK